MFQNTGHFQDSTIITETHRDVIGIHKHETYDILNFKWSEKVT